ncbi:unnamed protein product [Rhizophagus irregularis]|nr:unnamed protein product [Rhizophagus irregularis]
MKSLILGDCDDLIKFILFGDEKTPRIKNKELGHIPTNKLWPGKKLLKDDDLDFDEIKDKRLKNKEFKIRSSMELAIYHCKDKDTNIVAYLLEYYSKHAIYCAGWLHTVSKAIPLLLEYNYDDYVEKLFFKECFTGQTQDSFEVPIKLLSNNKFKAFEVDKLKSYKYESYNKKKKEEFKIIESPLLRKVPLPGFNQNNIKKKKEHNVFKRILDAILFLFIPRWYKIKQNEKIKLSPFSRMVLCKNDNIYNNPAIEAIINFDWHEARNHFIAIFLRFLIFSICFGLISWTYLNNNTNINQNFLFILIVLFYYLAIYLLIAELLKFIYRGFKKYFSEIYYIFGVISIIFPVIIISIMLKNSDNIGSVKEIDSELILGISFSIFLIWIQLIFYLRLAPYIGIYIYHFLIICKELLPFFLVIMIVILAFAHTMFLLLRNPVNISTNDSTYSGVATNSLTNESLNIKLKSDFDPNSNDNPYTSFYKAIMTTYFWTSGNWIQREQFDFWAVDIYSFIARNMLIAFMSDEYKDVKDKSRQILLKHKANRVADYEALYHFNIFSNDIKAKPKFIYYIGQPENYEEWNNIRKANDKCTIYKDLVVEHISTKFIFGERNYDHRSIWEY